MYVHVTELFYVLYSVHNGFFHFYFSPLERVSVAPRSMDSFYIPAAKYSVTDLAATHTHTHTHTHSQSVL
jgi:hypothetical protein